MTTALLALLLSPEGPGKEMGPFKVEGGLILWTWIVFIALFFILKKFAWPAILKSAEEREQAVQRQLDDANRLQAEAQKLAEENSKALAEAKATASSILADARNQAERDRATALERTKAEQDEMIQRAIREIGVERDKALSDLRREAVDLSLAAASNLIGEKLDSESDRKLVASYLSSLEGKH